MLMVVADQGTLTGASSILHKTPSAISQGIKQLESRLNVVLFNRDTYRLTLTPEGQHICQHAQRVLNEINEIEQITHNQSAGYEHSLSMVIDATFNIALITPVLARLQAFSPNTQVHVKQEHISGAIGKIESDQADIAITHEHNSRLSVDRLDIKRIGTTTLVNVASPALLDRHPSLHQLDELREEFQIVVNDSGFATAGKFLGVQLGQRKWFTNSFETKAQLIISGIGWGRIPEYMARVHLDSGQLKRIEVGDADASISSDVVACKLKSKILGPVGAFLWQNLN